MIVEILETVGMTSAAAGATAGAARGVLDAARLVVARRAADRYRRCLASIDRLERDLWPEWFRTPDVVRQKVELIRAAYGFADLDMHPGARWPVNSPEDVTVLYSSRGAISSTAASPPMRVSLDRVRKQAPPLH